MNDKEKEIADLLLEEICSAGTIEYRSIATNSYNVFMNTVRARVNTESFLKKEEEYERFKREDGEKRKAQES